jgi:hypothetical protein
MQKNEKMKRRVLARVLAEQLPSIAGGVGALRTTQINGHLDLTDSREADSLP